ncbi:MAG: two-component system, NarL family, nitrate/nitrite response regulator NarL [Chloroflexota bacterium]|nr:two-component system, NarL family, nitrate/nitrite response regulator NarL [Chloroflexota bacterium]
MTPGLGAESAAAAPDRAPTPLDRAVRVGLIEDHNLVREGLRLVLTANGFDVVGESPSVEGAFDLLEQKRPDVILLDLSLVDGDGVALLRELHTRSPQTRVVVVTMHRDPETVRQALVAGADGYVVKGAHTSELVEAIRAVMRGERYLHSSITSSVVDDSIRWMQSGVLTAREREILGLLASGMGVIDVARRLGISPHTVRRHVANLSEKIGARGTAALVKYAIQEGLVRQVDP